MQSFFCIKEQLHLTGYFVAMDSKWQPITWEIHEIYLLTSQPFNFYVHIDRTIRFDYLIRKSDFVSCKIISIQLPKSKKLTKEQNLMLDKMHVYFY